jgi:predicted AAA+ superfamily ATPase
MLARIFWGHLELWLGEFPAVALLGPRQVGKTTLARQWAAGRGDAVYLDLENPADLARLADPAAFLRAQTGRTVVLDEIQRAPHLFPLLRGIIDERRSAGAAAGQFLLLGSASGALLAQSAESLAGRIAYLELPPLSPLEVAADESTRLWLRGGFPQAFLARSDAASLRWRQQFIATYLERDIPQLGPRIPAQTLRRLWTMLAHEQGQIVQAARLASALAISGQTVARYIDVLCDVMLVRRLQPWASNEGKRLVRTPKLLVRDSGLTHALLGLSTVDDLLSHSVAGGSWEGWVIENLLAVAPYGSSPYFYRSSGGAEIDLVLELPDRQRWAVEVKRSSAPTVNRGFHIAADDIAATHRFVAHGGSDRFPMGGQVQAVPWIELAQSLRRLSTI